ncbi:MAG: penicillin-binding protein [Bacteroidaceae bacterium]|nr:penicillin-binding protein [Bacteroidaceae bacterium]
MNVKTAWTTLRGMLKKLYTGPWYKKIVAWTCTVFLSIIFLFIAIDFNLFNLFGSTPSFADIKNPTVSEASEVYSADGKLIGRYYDEDRTAVEYEEISPILIRTLIDTEDERFYHHHGIDFEGLFAAVKDIFSGHARGASTITQQLAKNMFRVRTKHRAGLLAKVPGINILVMKAKEWIVATKLEIIFSKEQILTMYLNTVDFGCNSFGIKTASAKYFNTTPDRLTYEQAATLTGLLKATSIYNPKTNPKNSIERRNTVLDVVFNHNHIVINGNLANYSQLDSLKSLPIELAQKSSEKSPNELAPYFRDELIGYLDMLCELGEVPGYDSGNKLNLFSDGLKIYTTLDTRLQQYAEEAVRKKMQSLQGQFYAHWGSTPPWQDSKHRVIPDFIENIARKTPEYKRLKKKYSDNKDSIDYYLNLPHPVKVFTYDGPAVKELSTMDSIRYMVRFMHCGFIAMEPDTREVKAWIGDIDYDAWNFDNVTARHQPGSTFKLFVYTEAMNQGLSPLSRRMDTRIEYREPGEEKAWVPHNADGTYSNSEMTLKRAFASSINSVAVSVGLEVGVKNIINTAYSMGIKTPLQENKSLCLGSSVVDLLELTNSYCTVVNDGKYNIPILISRIEDRDGNIIYKATRHEKQAIPYKSAFLMQVMLRSGLHGTSAAMWEYIGGLTQATDFGGKTGTSNNHADAWYVGVTPKLVGGVWVGGEFPCIHFRTGALGQGGKAALPIFGDFIRKVLHDDRFSKYRVKFSEPKDIDRKLWVGGESVETPDSSFSTGYESTDYPAENTLPDNGNNDTQTEVLTTEE